MYVCVSVVDLLVGAPLFMDRGSDGKLKEVGQVGQTHTNTQEHQKEGMLTLNANMVTQLTLHMLHMKINGEIIKVLSYTSSLIVCVCGCVCVCVCVGVCVCVRQVSVHLGRGGFSFHPAQVLTGSEKYARYGSAIAILGDLDRDGFNGNTHTHTHARAHTHTL